MTAPSRQPDKRALLIGINTYPLLAADRQLTGCVNDVQLMRQVLMEPFGFPDANIAMLTNEQATRDAILAAFEALTAATGPDDLVVIHYAGHGGQMTDLEGDEPSGLDSTLVPHDSAGWSGVNRDITDDELELILESLGAKTRYITLIFDCCHSGTITRDVLAARARSLPPDVRSKEELLTMRSALPAAPPRPSGPSGWLPMAEKYVLIAGCRDAETSFEYQPPEGGGTVNHGALTYFLCQQLRQATPGTTYRDVFERAAARVNAESTAQHPQMEGKADREVFGVRDIEPARFVRVIARDGTTVTLGAGAAHSVTVGSVYAIHAQGTKQPRAASLIGEVVVDAVDAVTATAQVTSESVADAIVEGARAFETSHAFGDQRLRVALPVGESGEVAALRQSLESSTLVEVAAEGATVTAHLLLPRASVAPGDPVPRAGALTAPAWAVTGENGDLLMPLKHAGQEATIRENLEKIARYRHALAFENPNPDSALRGKFKLDLLRRSEAGELTVAEPDVAGGQIVYDEGDVIVFRITSDHDTPVFISLVDFGLTGAVDLILPFREASSQRSLGPGVQFEYETSPKKLFRVTWPANFPFVDTVDHATEAEGIDTVKLFITEQPADFSVLQQKGVRSLGRTATPLGDLLHRVFQGSGTRDVGRAEPIDAEWTTVARSFVVRRKATKELSSTGTAVELGGAKLVTKGLSGTATTRFGPKGREEAAALVSGDLHDALQASGVEERQTVEIAGAQETGPATRSIGEQPAMELQLREPDAGFGQMVMAADELGVISWHVAPVATAVPGTRGGAGPARTRSYLIPRSVPSEQPAPGPSGTRGIVSALGRKVLKELVFPLIDPIVGEVGAGFVNRMETKRWPYRVRSFLPEDFATANARELAGDDWKRLGTGRALLFVHGTFSRAHLAFGQLPADVIAELHRRYDGRVFAYDHFTLSHDPAENVKRLLATIPDGVGLDVDIVCHSRGGLVSRLLVERLATFGADTRRFRVGRVVFVGSPNAGTPLASPTRTGDFIDVCTNVLDVLPDNGVTDVLTMLISVVKQLAVGVLGGLDGLQSMNPDGEFARQLNNGARSGDAKYFAITSNAAPTEPGLKRLLITKGYGKLMAGANDLVVPTEGVFKENGSGFFPIEERLVLDGADGVTHTHYFGHARVQRKILEWLTV